MIKIVIVVFPKRVAHILFLVITVALQTNQAPVYLYQALLQLLLLLLHPPLLPLKLLALLMVLLLLPSTRLHQPPTQTLSLLPLSSILHPLLLKQLSP